VWFKRVESDEDNCGITFLNNQDNEINCPYKLTDNVARLLLMHFTPVQDKSVDISTLTMKIGILKKENQVMENTIYFL